MLKLVLGNSLRHRLARNSAWSVMGTGLYQVLLVGSSIIAARLLGGEMFGRYGVIQSTTALFGTFIGTALGLASTKHIAEYRDVDPARAGRMVTLCASSAVVLGVSASALLFLMAGPLATRVFHDSTLLGPLGLSSLLLLFHIWNGSQQGSLAGFEAFSEIARINAARGLAVVALSFWAIPRWKLEGAVWALVLSAGLACALSTLAIRRALRERNIITQWRAAWGERRILVSFSLPALLTSSVIAPTGWLMNVLLANQPGGYSQLGIFTAANHWRLAVCLFPASVTQVATPVLANLLGTSQKARFTRTLRISLLFTTLAAVAAAVLVIALGKLIMRSYGKDFEGGLAALLILQVAAVLTTASTALGAAIATTGRMWTNFLLNLLWSVMLVAIVYPQHHRTADSVAWAFVAAYAVLAILQVTMLQRWHNSLDDAAPAITSADLSEDSVDGSRMKTKPEQVASLRSARATGYAEAPPLN